MGILPMSITGVPPVLSPDKNSGNARVSQLVGEMPAWNANMTQLDQSGSAAPLDTRPPQDKRTHLDLWWREGNLAALLALLVIATATLARQSSRAGVVVASEDIPVNPARVAQGQDWIDPNTASSASLQRIPGIGPRKAQAIVEYRAQHGPRPFEKADDLKKVRGIGPVLCAAIARFMAPASAPADEDDSSWQDQAPPP